MLLGCEVNQLEDLFAWINENLFFGKEKNDQH